MLKVTCPKNTKSLSGEANTLPLPCVSRLEWDFCPSCHKALEQQINEKGGNNPSPDGLPSSISFYSFCLFFCALQVCLISFLCKVRQCFPR